MIRISVVLVVVIALLGAMLFIFSALYNVPDPSPKLYGFDRKKSSFVDYEITGDKIRFRYSFAFTNYTDRQDFSITISAKFPQEDVEGWVPNDLYFACDEHGKREYFVLAPNAQTDVVATFYADYLGGKVNTALSFPEIFMTPTIIVDASTNG